MTWWNEWDVTETHINHEVSEYIITKRLADAVYATLTQLVSEEEKWGSLVTEDIWIYKAYASDLSLSYTAQKIQL